MHRHRHVVAGLAAPLIVLTSAFGAGAAQASHPRLAVQASHRRPTVSASAGRPAIPGRVRSHLRPERARGPVCRQRLVVPAYFNPGPDWSAMVAGGAGGMQVIVNPASGLGAARDPVYAKSVQLARQAGAELLGYVDTKYAAVPLVSAERQVRQYASWYGVTDIFFDDVSSTAAKLPYYGALSRYVRDRTSGAVVMLNPGDYPAEGYARLGDQLVVAEYGYDQFLSTAPPSWLAGFPSSEFVTILSGVPQHRLASVLELARRRGLGGVYATDVATSAGDLYEQLPSYWSSERADVAADC